MANNFEVSLPAQGWVIPSSGGCGRALWSTPMRPVLAFDDTTSEVCYSPPFRMPASYTGAGTLKADIEYAMLSATSGGVVFGVSVEAVTPGDALDLSGSASFDTENTNSGTVPATAKYLQEITVTLTNKDSVAAGDMVRLKLARKPADASDTATGDAYVLNVCVREEA